MVGSIPFTTYDFFGYLAQGFVALVALDAAFFGDPSLYSPGTAETLILIVASYAAGQMIGQLAGGLFETYLFDKTSVGFPSVNLFVDRRKRRCPLRFIFGAYWRPFPQAVRDRILDKAGALNVTGPRSAAPEPRPRRHFRNAASDSEPDLAEQGEALFDHCYGTLKVHDTDSGRLANLLNVYAFCRNMSLTLMLSAIALTIGALRGTAHTGGVVEPGWWAVGTSLAALALFLRYLKIYRLFHEAVFTTYAEACPEPAPARPRWSGRP